jgi:LPS sulfotransferase NodH
MSYTKFVLIGTGRTGSTLLKMLLNSHANIKIFEEIIHTESDVRSWATEVDSLKFISVNEDPIKYLSNHIFREYTEDIKAVGFKLFYQQARNSEWKHIWEYLRNTKVKVIHIKRKNLLARYLSLKLAFKTGVWSIEDPSKRVYCDPILLDPRECFKDFIEIRRFENETDKFFENNPKIETTYEKLDSNIYYETKRIINFLGLGYQQLSTKTHKQ